jgi:hypothetical protein
MKNRIINIVIFVVAILACCLAIAFSFFSFDADKKENYIQTQEVKAKTPEMVSDLETATVESLPSVIEKYKEMNAESAKKQKEDQIQKDILYTYLQDLKNLDENSFEGYKAKFSERSAGLFAKCDDKQKYVDGFNSVNTYKDLDAYTEKINKEYNEVKQNYLLERNYVKSANALINRADAINNTASAAKKTADLESFQSDLKSFGKSASLQNFFIILTYILGIGALALMVFFLLTNMIANFKTSYKILLGLLLLVVAFFIGYLVGTPTLSPSAIKAGMTGSGYKMVNAAVFTVYVCLFGAILAIIVSLIMNAVKNRN